MADYKFWLTKIEEGIFWRYLNNPDKKNAFDIKVVNELDQILEEEIKPNLNVIRILVFPSI